MPALTLNRLFIVAWAIVLGFLFVLAIDSFTATFGVDQSVFVYVAKGILQGEVPYLDRWDHKGPLIYLLNLIGLIIDETWGMWAIQGLFLLGSVWLSFATLKKVFGILPTLFALAVFLTLFPQVYATRELYRTVWPPLPIPRPLPLHPQRRTVQVRPYSNQISTAAHLHRCARRCLIPT